MVPADAAAIVGLLDPIIRAGGLTAMAPGTVCDQRAFIAGLPPRATYLLAEDMRGTLLGIQDILPIPGDGDCDEGGEISTFVRLGQHGRGIGRGLSDASFAAARARRHRRLFATIRADNPGALAFYRALGFRIVERRDGPPLATIRATRVLDAIGA
ncbi:N-acetyltransferase [Allostella vacuolata]|nr:N-acetyltransferase [Stella vacuolata]